MVLGRLAGVLRDVFDYVDKIMHAFLQETMTNRPYARRASEAGRGEINKLIRPLTPHSVVVYTATNPALAADS